jgi:hypothetical protein
MFLFLDFLWSISLLVLQGIGVYLHHRAFWNHETDPVAVIILSVKGVQQVAAAEHRGAHLATSSRI